MSEYDEIANEYKEAKQLELFEVTAHTMSKRLGDIAGKSVLDLACGEGHSTRAIKRLGAGRTVGADISAEMIRLAREQETKQPLGIEYLVSPAQTLGRLGEFDAVTATFLLNYAATKDDLRRMAHTAYQNLRPGGRFLAINDNCGRAADWDAQISERYGFRYRALARPIVDESQLEVTIVNGGQEFSFTISCFRRDTYEWALRDAGFTAIHWHGLSLPPELEREGGSARWAPFFEFTPLVLLECLT